MTKHSLLLVVVFPGMLLLCGSSSARAENLVFSRSSLLERANEVARFVLDAKQQQQHRTLQSISSDNGILTICQAVEASFTGTAASLSTTSAPAIVHCNCLGNLEQSFSVSCEYQAALCSEGDLARTCGRPQIAISMVKGRLFSATTCVRDAQRGMLPVADTCVFVDACPDPTQDGFCDCTASYGGSICGTCEICDGGKAISVNCTNVNAEAVSKECQAVDLDLELEAGAGKIAGFAPKFSGFCSQMESALVNTIQCDCTDAVGESFSVTCVTTQPTCPSAQTQDGGGVTGDGVDGSTELFCGKVESTVKIVSGAMQSVTACGTYDSIFGETCTVLEFCSEGEEKICGCVATYDGKACSSCNVCDDGTSLTLDCSNVFGDAKVETCQAVSSKTVFEFLPNYPKPKGSEVGYVQPSGNEPGFGFDNKAKSSGRALKYWMATSGLALVITTVLL
jgi:hypothetical protein